MPKNFSLFLALRYLKPKRTFVSVITLISIMGVTLGVVILLVVIGVMSGFEHEIKQKILGFEPHVLVAPEYPLDFWPELREDIRDVNRVEDVLPYTQGQVILEFNHRRLAPKMRGFEPDDGPLFQRLAQLVEPGPGKLGEGEFNLDGDNAVVGRGLADGLDLRVGDIITIYSPKNMEELLDALGDVEERQNAGEDISEALRDVRNLVLPIELEVTGIFDSGRYDFDSEFLFVPLHIGQELYSLGGAVHGLAIQTDDPYHAYDTKEALTAELHPSLRVFTWMDLNRQMLGAVDMERRMMFFLLFFITIVAGFCIMNTLITVTVLKRREIGVLRALGAGTFQVVAVFLVEGMIVGLIGSVCGLILGGTILHFRNEIMNGLAGQFGIEMFPKEIYMLGELPARILPKDVAFISTAAFLSACISALIPAGIAASFDPAKALRTDQ